MKLNKNAAKLTNEAETRTTGSFLGATNTVMLPVLFNSALAASLHIKVTITTFF